MTDIIKDYAKSLNMLYNQSHALAAIWLNIPLQTSTERTVRLTEGHEVRIEDNRLVDVTEKFPASHKVNGCFGTLVSQFEISVVDLKTNEPSIIKLH